MWLGTAEWFGIPANKMLEVLPMHKNFPPSALYNKTELFDSIFVDGLFPSKYSIKKLNRVRQFEHHTEAYMVLATDHYLTLPIIFSKIDYLHHTASINCSALSRAISSSSH